jgi:hypothetical protein
VDVTAAGVLAWTVTVSVATDPPGSDPHADTANSETAPKAPTKTFFTESPPSFRAERPCIATLGSTVTVWLTLLGLRDPS